MSVAAQLVDGSGIPPDARPVPAAAQHALWRHIFGDGKGLLATYSGRRVAGEQELQDGTSRYFAWPGQWRAASRWLLQESARGRCAYVCAHLVTKPRRIKANAATMWAAYVDGDGATVPSTLARPTAVVESSPGREQLYWRFTRAVDPVVGEQLNKRLAKAMGADMSGWDLTQLLRAPGTQNWKYEGGPEVRILSIEDRAYDPDELDRILPPLPTEAERATVRLEAGAAALRDDDQARIDKMLSGKRGAEVRHLWSGGSKLSKPDGSPDHSGDDLSLMNALAFWLDKDPARMAAAFRSSNRYRPKLDEVHAADGRTYLELTIGEAIGDCRETYGDLVARRPKPSPVPTTPAVDDPAATDDVEALRAEVLRLRRALLDRDDKVDELAQVIQVQQARLQDVVLKLEAKTQFLSHVTDILAKPNEELSAGEKVVSIALAYEIHFRADKETYRLPDGTEGSYRTESGNVRMPRSIIAKRTGYSPGKAATLGRQVAERENAPFKWRTTREWKTRADGSEGWVTTIELEPRTERTTDTLRAIAALPALPDKPKHGGSPAATEARWGRCDKHDNREVRLTGHCPDCGKIVGERMVTRAEFDALKVQDGIPEDPSPAVDVYVPKGNQDGIPDAAVAVQVGFPEGLDELTLARRAREALDVPHGRAPEPSKQPGYLKSESQERVSLGPIVVKPKPWRCACGSLERGPRSDGTIVCDGCGEPVATVRELAPGVVETVRDGETTIARDPSLPAVDKDVTGGCPRCGPGRILRQRGGVWTCADCRAEVTA